MYNYDAQAIFSNLFYNSLKFELKLLFRLYVTEGDRGDTAHVANTNDDCEMDEGRPYIHFFRHEFKAQSSALSIGMT